jgi:hypothetical protein
MRRLAMLVLCLVGCSGSDEPEPEPMNEPCIAYVPGPSVCKTVCCVSQGLTLTIERCNPSQRCVSCGSAGTNSCVIGGAEYACHSECNLGSVSPPNGGCPSTWSPCGG